MQINYRIKQIYNRIFLVTIKDSYDLAMTFCRLQEYYESPFKQIRNKTFTITNFQRLYAKKFGDGVFTYPADWMGFNVPGDVVDDFMSVTFDDWGNEYDLTISDIHWQITDEGETYNKQCPYYLIGSQPKDRDTINHEICHALYYLDSEYKNRALNSLSKLDKKLTKSAKQYLLSIGYSKNTLNDELQAYISTDDYMIFDNIKINKKQKDNLHKVKSELVNTFLLKTEEYKKNLKIK